MPPPATPPDPGSGAGATPALGPTSAPAPSTQTDSRARIVGVDVARGLAIFGMLVAHAIPRPNDTELLVDGRSSILFATLAGVSLGLMTGAARPTGRGIRSDRIVSVVLRAIFIFLIGIVLSSFDSDVAVILDYYGIMFLLLTPVLFFPRWALAALGVGLIALAPILGAGQGDVNTSRDTVAYFVDYYFLNGYYPILIWLPFLLAGLIAARSGLTRPRTRALMIGVGAFFALAGYGAAAVLPGISAEAHSGSTAEVLGSGGLAIAIIGALLWLTAPERASLGRAARGALWPIAAAGSMALTVYTLQIVALIGFVAVREGNDPSVPAIVDYPGVPLLVGMVLASLLFASLWRVFFGKGPLERMLAAATRRPRTP
ncbi:DUF418 domain-containing protein [Cryobacterium melibiosiphilum]|uniref:DUF418 domain-containing protein n=1 Tax=Cryobacterium melibiosiphilum TaxID=995039 RepID=A0A3A5MNI1_9MICO|nr:DUF418 domain-containing protein [Cryobacterium melibiosiphilum]RJT88473.1 DUF418 domain-containing protein [Cryobacterium melibiosiphilum]